MTYAIGLDVGVTNVKAVCVTPAGQIIARQSFPTLADSPDWPQRVEANIAELESKHGRAAYLGLSAPGVAAPDGSRIRWMRGRLIEVQDLRWSEFLARPIPVLNDAQAALLGEIWQGAARGASNAILITLGTGVGGAAMVDGRILKGHLGRAGHLGHITVDMHGPTDICSLPGSIEYHIGDYSIPQRTAGAFRHTHELVRAYRDGDPHAKKIWLASLQALAATIASLINVLDPQIVIIGGGIIAAGDALLTPLTELLRPIEWQLNDEPRVPIVLAQLAEYAGALGAAHNAIESAKPS